MGSQLTLSEMLSSSLPVRTEKLLERLRVRLGGGEGVSRDGGEGVGLISFSFANLSLFFFGRPVKESPSVFRLVKALFRGVG